MNLTSDEKRDILLSLQMWANYIETGSITNSKEDLIAMNIPVQPTQPQQQKRIKQLRELAERFNPDA